VDLAAVFLLSLLGGYVFAYLWKRTAYATRRAEGHHLYFRAAFCGVVLFAIALGFRQGLLALICGYRAFDNSLVEYVKPVLKEENGLGAAELRSRAQWVITSVYSLLIGPLAASVLNLFTPRWWALERSVGAFDRLLLQAQRAEMPVSLTLTTGKVYIGPVVSITDPDGIPTVTILPVFSGYRGEEGRMVLTTDYDRVYADLEKGGAKQLGLPADWQTQFNLTIRADTIVTASLFSPSVYARFTPEWREQLAEHYRKLSSAPKRRTLARPPA
jgi:hypothetical protein